jgi:hypothetical protein
MCYHQADPSVSQVSAMKNAMRLAAMCCVGASSLPACNPEIPIPEPQASVPAVTSMWLGQAYFAVEAAGLGPVECDSDGQCPGAFGGPSVARPTAFRVAAQAPSPGAMVVNGSDVRLYLVPG